MEALERLVSCLSRLPGVGKRSAERMALRLARSRNGLLAELTAALKEVESKVSVCSSCGSLTDGDRNPCRLCTDPQREGRLLCVVEDPSDIMTLERSGSYHGRYHALMGKISAMQGQGPGDLRIRALLKRVADENIEEVLLALNTDVESDATAGFLATLLRGRRVKVTRLAFGLPVGSGIMYSDPLTLSRAIKGRQEA